MIRYDLFQSVKHVAPIPQFKTFEDFTQSFVNFESSATKEDRKRSFSFTEYQPGLTRGKDNVVYMTGFVFDFDNKDCKPVTIKSVLEKLENKTITYLWYHTYSHSKEHLRWRLVIPFGKFIKPDIWEEMYERGLELIGNPPGIDPVSKKSSQIYFYPYQPPHCNTIFQAETFYGHLLNPFDLDSIHKKVKEIITVPVPPIEKPGGWQRKEKPIDEIDKIRESLTYISPDVDYLDWIKVGMALKSELGDSGIDIWDSWSKKGLKYTNRAEILYKWATFTQEGINIGSLYSLAKERGYKIPGYSVETKKLLKTTFVEKDITVYTEVEEDIVEEAISSLQPFVSKDIFDIPCPIVKDLYEWINLSAVIIQPLYSLATTLSLIGFLKRDVICSPTNIKTNLYILSMGPSRSGKNNGLQCINKIMNKLSLEGYLVTGIGSHQGLLSKMNENKGFIYVKLDEISYIMGTMQSKNASSHEKNIEQKLLSLYNCDYQTSDAIKGEKLEKVDNPFLHIYSTTTEQITETLKSNSATSGLLARFLIFQVVPGMPYIDNLVPRTDIPTKLLDSLASLQKETYRKAIFNEDAIQWYRQFTDKVRTLQQKLNKEQTKMDSLFGNLGEQATKLALLTTPFKEHIPFGDRPHQVVEKWPFIRIEDIQWGVAVAVHCLKNNISMTESFSDNTFEKIYKKLCKKIQDKTKDGNWIGKSELYKSIHCEGGLYNFEGIIKHLLDEQKIDVEKNYRSRGFKIRWITPKVRKEMEKELEKEKRKF